MKKKFVREIEVHQAARADGATLRVYFCVYEESVEEQRYLTALTCVLRFAVLLCLGLVLYLEMGRYVPLLEHARVVRPPTVLLTSPPPLPAGTVCVYGCVRACRREKEAFERLVQEKKHMVVPTNVFEAAAVAPQPGAYLDKLVADTVGCLFI